MKYILLLILTICTASAEVNILILGSGRSYSEGLGKLHQKPLDIDLLTSELKNILNKDKKLGKTNVQLEKYYTTKRLKTAIGGRGGLREYDFHCYSLAQYFFWPDQREKRLSNLRGEESHKWDHVILIGDPFLAANMPGVHAEGLKLLSTEIRKGKAKVFHLSKWPTKDSGITAEGINGTAHIISKGLNIEAIPTAFLPATVKKAKAEDIKIETFTAGSIYLTLFPDKKKLNSIFKPRWNNIITKSLEKAQAQGNQALQSKIQTPFSPHLIGDKQLYTGNHTGSSTERGLTGQLSKVFAHGASRFTLSRKPKEGQKIDINYGRANSNFEPQKRYKVDPQVFTRSYGIVMQDHGNTAYETMLYGIDKRTIPNSKHVDDGTDIGVALAMQTRNVISKGARAIPGRLISAKIMDYDKSLIPVKTKGDRWHQQQHVLLAQASFVFTSLTGKYGFATNKKTSKKDSMMLKIGYDTAWTMSTLQARSPGLVVRPDTMPNGKKNNVESKSISLFFANKPTEDVIVGVLLNGKLLKKLIFQSDKHLIAQKVSLPDKKKPTDKIEIRTQSKDKAFNDLKEFW